MTHIALHRLLLVLLALSLTVPAWATSAPADWRALTATGGMIASQGDRFNRQLHQNEAQWLTAKRKAVGAEQGERYDAAACFLLLCAQGVPTTDPKYAALVTMQAAGGTYTAELNELRGQQAKEMFTYTPMDVVNDFLLRHDEAVRRSGGVLKVASGSLGMASGAGMATGAALGCGPSAGTSCLLVPVGAGLLMLSYEEAKAGTAQAAGSYSSTEGSRVLASFNADSYPGERDRIKELGLDLATAGLLAATAKLGAGAMDKLGAKLEKWWAERMVKEVPPLRQAYVDAVSDLKPMADSLRAAGADFEAIARALHAERPAIGEEFKALTPADKLAVIYERNLQRYGDKLGPTVDWLRTQGKSWDQIIESATRTGGKDLGF
jgi:hypothetical protein